MARLCAVLRQCSGQIVPVLAYAALTVACLGFKRCACSGPAGASGDPTYHGVAEGADHRGIEGQATCYVGGGLFRSFTGKHAGNGTVYDTSSDPDIPGGAASRVAHSNYYWLGDLSLGYGQKLNAGFIRSFKVRFQVGNLFNREIQVLDGIDANPANAYTKDVFNVLPTRNYFLTLSAEF